MVDFQLSNLATEIHSQDDIEILLSEITDILINNARTHIPRSIPRPHVRPNWTAPIKQAHALSKQKYREWVVGGRPYDQLNPLKVSYKDAKRAFRREFRRLRRNEAEDFYNSMDPSNPNIFQMVRKKLGHSPSLTHSLRVNDQLFQGEGLHEAWASYFESLYSHNIEAFDMFHISTPLIGKLWIYSTLP